MNFNYIQNWDQSCSHVKIITTYKTKNIKKMVVKVNPIASFIQVECSLATRLSKNKLHETCLM